MKIEYQEKPMDVIIDYYCAAYGDAVTHWEWFCDPNKNTVILKLYIDESKNKECK